MLVLEGLVGLHRTLQLQLLQHYWLGQRLGLHSIAHSFIELDNAVAIINK